MALEQEIKVNDVILNQSIIVDKYVKRDKEMNLKLCDQIEQSCKKVFPYSIQYIQNYVEALIFGNLTQFLKNYDFSYICNLFSFESHKEEICKYWSNLLRINLEKDFRRSIRKQFSEYISFYNLNMYEHDNQSITMSFQLKPIELFIHTYMTDFSQKVLFGQWSDIGPVRHVINENMSNEFISSSIVFTYENINLNHKYTTMIENYERSQDLRSSSSNRELYLKMSCEELEYLGY